MRGKMRRPSGTWATPRSTISWVGRRVMSWPSSLIVPARATRAAADRHQEGRLAGAVGADQGHDLAVRDIEVDPVQGLDGAVECRHGPDFKHGPPQASGPPSSVPR